MVKFNCFYDEQKIHHEWWGPVSQYFSTEVTKFGLKCIMPIAHSHTHTHSTHILIKNARKCLNIGCLKLKTTPVTSTKVRPLKWRLLLYVQSYHVIKIEHTMIIICCLLPCGFWDVDCWVDANFLSVFRVYFKSSVLLLHYLHWRQEVKRGMHRFKLRRDILNRLRARAISYLLSCTHKIYRQVLNYGRSIRITFLVVSFFLS